MIDKKELLFDRDEDGNLIPQEIELVIDESDPEQAKYKGKTIAVIPISRGELKKLFAPREEGKETFDLDDHIIATHCVNPKFTEEEAKYIKPPFTNVLVNTIFVASGLERRKNDSKQSVDDAEDEFAKN